MSASEGVAAAEMKNAKKKKKKSQEFFFCAGRLEGKRFLSIFCLRIYLTRHPARVSSNKWGVKTTISSGDGVVRTGRVGGGGGEERVRAPPL